MNFKRYLLKEEVNLENIFNNKVGNILDFLHKLNDNKDKTSVRDLMEDSEVIVNEIRRLLHSNWDIKYLKDLKVLQKCGVSIMNSIVEKGDIRSIIESCISEINNIVSDKPINKLN